MKVPKDVRDVERPDHTIVYVYGKNHDRYAVKERRFEKVDGKVVQKDGPTIGYIENGKFVPKDERPKIRYSPVTFKQWGGPKFIDSLCGDLLEDLMAVYHRDDAIRMYIMAALRTLDPGLRDDEMDEFFGRTWYSEIYPKVALSDDTVGRFLHDLGVTWSHIVEFMRIRASHIPENRYLAVDGMLKSDESEVNSFSEPSRKALKKGTCDISVMFAFDTEEMEPVCSKAYPGNVLDMTSFRDFLMTNNVGKGVLIADKGFNYNKARDVFLDNPGLHFILPIKKDAKVIKEYKMLSFNSSLKNRNGIECRHERMHDGRHLYSFRDTGMAMDQENKWIIKNPNYDPYKLSELRKEFGTIVLMSDLDVKPEFVYTAYEERWEIEVFFRTYKNILEMDETRVHDNESLIGTEFVNFLSTVMMCRMRKAFLKVGATSKRSLRKNLRFVRKGVMVKDSSDSDWHLMQLTAKDESLFAELGIIKVEPQPTKKRGRPPKNKVVDPV